MTRDQALIIARRIMDRCEIDRALHLDAIADEVIAGAALIGEPPTMGARFLTADEIDEFNRTLSLGVAKPRWVSPDEVAELAKLDRRKSAIRMDQ